MELRTLLENASDDVKELNAELLDSLKRGAKKGLGDSAPAISQAEATFATYWQILGGPELVREYQFDPDRKWRLDFYEPESRIAIEIHGGTFSGGRHVRPRGYAKDREKMNAATAAGIEVYELVTPVDFTEVEKICKLCSRHREGRRHE